MTTRVRIGTHPNGRVVQLSHVVHPVLGIAVLLLGGRAFAYDLTDADCAHWKKGTPQYVECVQKNEQDRTDVPAVHISGRLLNGNERDNRRSSAPLDPATANNAPPVVPKGPSGRDKAAQIIERARQAARDAGQTPVDER